MLSGCFQKNLYTATTIFDICSATSVNDIFLSETQIDVGVSAFTDNFCIFPAPDGFYVESGYRQTWGEITGGTGIFSTTGTCYDCFFTGTSIIIPQFTTFSDCCNSSYLFNVYHDIGTFNIGETYNLITDFFSGCATVVETDICYPFYCLTIATLNVDCVSCNSTNSIECTIYTCENGCYDLNTDGLTPYDGKYCQPGFETYNNYNYYKDVATQTYYIYYDTSKWCLSTSLGGPCLLFGNEFCNSNCPDICDELTISNCTTTTTNPCDTFDFQSIFDCFPSPTITPTSTITPTTTPTPTITPTPSSTELCPLISISLSATTLPGESPTPTPTPSPTQPVRDNCFLGEGTYDGFSSEFNCII